MLEIRKFADKNKHFVCTTIKGMVYKILFKGTHKECENYLEQLVEELKTGENQ